MEEDLFGAMNQFLDETPAPIDDAGEIDNETTPVEDDTIVNPEIVDEGKIEDIVDPEGSDTKNDTSSLLFSFASTLVEDGVLPSLDLEKAKIESTSDLIDAIRNEIKSNEFGNLTDLQKEALEAFRHGVPVETFAARKQEATKLSSITRDTLEDDFELRKELIKRDFLSKGYSEDKANKFVQRSIDLGEDIDDALEALESQKKLVEMQTQREVEEAKKQEAAAIKDYEEQMKKLKDKVYNETNEVIPGIKFNKTIADQVYESMTKVVDEVNGQPINRLVKDRLENPIEFEYKLHYLYTLTKGFKDFSKLMKTEKSKAIKDFESKLNLNTYNKQYNPQGPEPDWDFVERALG